MESETELTLLFEESARIGEAEALRDELSQALSAPQPLISLDLTAVESVDVTFFQLALSLQKSLKEEGRHLILRPLADGHPVAETARLLGMPLAHHFTLVEASR